MTASQSAVVSAITRTGRQTRIKRAIRFPLVRILIALIIVSATLNGTRAALRAAGLSPVAGSPHRIQLLLLYTVATIVVVHLAYLLYVRLVERRQLTEFTARGAATELGYGALTGMLLFAITIGVLRAGGWYHVTGTNAWTAMAQPLLLAAGAAYVEELIVRGILFQKIEDMLGSWTALALTAIIFGLLHMANPHATIVAAIAIALEAGVLLGAAYLATRRLWLAIGIHFGWNFVQGGIFGVAVSGVTSNGLLRGELHGPPLLSGGSFGAEGSVIAVVACLAVAIPLIRIAQRRGHISPPMWQRRPAVSDVPGAAGSSA
jgi:uncharacterized protein